MTLSHIIVYNAEPKYGSIISGIPGHDIEDVALNDIRIYCKGRGMKTQTALEPPEKETEYLEPAMFGEIPAYGFFIRHARGLEMRDITLKYLKDDVRPPFILSNAKSVDFRNIKAQHAPGVPTLILKGVEDFSIRQSYLLRDVRLGKVKLQQL